jgi:hypothetical protein
MRQKIILIKKSIFQISYVEYVIQNSTVGDQTKLKRKKTLQKK